MKISAYHILRVGLAITFLWIGVLIFQDPIGWGAYLQPWAANLLFIPLKQVMISTAILDMVIGLLLLIDVFTWIVGSVAAIHLVIILITSGINAITVRDIGLLAAVVALTMDARRKNKNKSI